jgi:hypothetical protein
VRGMGSSWCVGWRPGFYYSGVVCERAVGRVLGVYEGMRLVRAERVQGAVARVATDASVGGGTGVGRGAGLWRARLDGGWHD